MTDWYYADATHTQHGPVTTAALLALRQEGRIHASTLLWRDGLPGWRPLADLAAELDATSAAAAWRPDAAGPTAAHPDSGTGWHPAIDRDTPAATSPYAPPVAPVVAAAQVTHGGEVVDAGFLKRAAALFIDAVLITVVYYALIFAVMMVFGLSGMFSAMSSGDPSQFGGAVFGLMAAVYLGYPVISGLYYVSMESSARQATLGKLAVGIKVAALDGSRLSRGHALGRWASHLLNYLTLYIGYLVALFTRRKQGLHDLVASTYVVDQWAYTGFPERQERGLGTVATVILVIWAVLMLLGVGLVILAGIAASF
ncbi:MULTISPECIES: RDD family protein [Luteimonas]|uniref:RDD family protein n=2 Tax=Gammaproteobacteria TaxID=1236 RepID=UPI0013045928|nr:MULTISPECIES: RDD family protein [Luteimonas]